MGQNVNVYKTNLFLTAMVNNFNVNLILQLVHYLFRIEHGFFLASDLDQGYFGHSFSTNFTYVKIKVQLYLSVSFWKNSPSLRQNVLKVKLKKLKQTQQFS